MPIHVQMPALAAVQQLQRYDIVFQNMLASNQHVVVERAMQIPLICYESFPWIKKQLAIFLSIAGRAFWLQHAQQELEWSLQLVEHLLFATRSLQSGPLRWALKGVL